MELGIDGDGFATRGSYPYHQVLVLEHLLQGLADPGLIVDDQDLLHLLLSGTPAAGRRSPQSYPVRIKAIPQPR